MFCEFYTCFNNTVSVTDKKMHLFSNVQSNDFQTKMTVDLITIIITFRTGYSCKATPVNLIAIYYII